MSRAALAMAALVCWCTIPRAAVAVDRRLGAGIAKPALTGAPWSADARAALTRDLDALLTGAPTLRGAHVGLLVIDTRSGDVLYARNADDAFQPASTLKLLTGNVALATLTPAYRFRTQALIDPAHASLVIRAGGDPLLRATDLDALARTVRASGVVALPGGVSIDADAFDAAPYPPGWSWDDLPDDYAAPISAATVEENVVHLRVTPGPNVGAPVGVRATPTIVRYDGTLTECAPGAGIVVRVRATTSVRGSADALDLERAPGGCIDVTGSLALGSAPETLDAAVPNPSAYVRLLAQNALNSAGVVVGVADNRTALQTTGQSSSRSPMTPVGMTAPTNAAAQTNAPAPTNTATPTNAAAPTNVPAPTNAVVPTIPATSGDTYGAMNRGTVSPYVVWTLDGEPLSDLLADMWWPSDNLIAETLLKEIGRRAGNATVTGGALVTDGALGTTVAGAAVERAWLISIGVDPATLTIADGSGLSSYDRITPRALAAILQADWNGPFRDLVLDDLPLAGVRGTLATSFVGSPAERRTYAKTGSVNHTRGLAGYLATLHHGALTFAWSVDDWMGSDADLSALRARVLSRLIGD
jgi:D-alanyl-D-alanine carboxypeptidase/D-alanyl-D-alanine-endopeptidase (penicillin-binding protein 4)